MNLQIKIDNIYMVEHPKQKQFGTTEVQAW